jgi:phage terminase large subunit-like protein
MARKNGKSALCAGIALRALLLDNPGAEIYSVAGDREQAKLVFSSARRMVEMEPDLANELKCYRDAIEHPESGNVYRVLSSDAPLKEGLNPTLVFVDEVHVIKRELWDVFALAAGARIDPLMVGITTAGSRTDSLGQDTLCYQLYQYGKKVAAGEEVDPSFFFAWWEPVAGAEADHRDPMVWAEANPGFGDIVSREDFESVINRTPESEFRTKRTNVFTTSSEAALPHGSWDALADMTRTPAEGVQMVVMADGSWAGDSTGYVACTIEDRPQMFVGGLWERPDDDPDWRVPIVDVEDSLEQFCRTHNVVELDFDPFRWQRSFQVLEERGLPVVEFLTSSLPRIVPAWQTFYDAVLDKAFTHDGDPRLARHVENMRLKIDAKGARPVKEHKMSNRHIDLGICAVGAYARAVFWRGEPEITFVGSWE